MRGPTRVISVGALGWGAGYLGWRVVATGQGADPAAWIVLILAEVLGLVAFLVRVWQSWPPTEPAPRRATAPGVTVIIDATSAPVADLRQTLVAVKAMLYRPEVRVVDERANRWMRTVAERVGATVLERSVGVTAAVESARTDWVLLLEPGDEPPIDLVDQLAETCAEDVAVVQLGSHDLATTPLDDASGPGPLVEPFEQSVMRPHLGRRGLLAWYGDTPAVVRKQAWIGEIGRGDPGSRVDEMDRRWRAGIGLIGSGSRITAAAVSIGKRNRTTVEERLDLRREGMARRRRSLNELKHTVRLERGPRVAHLAAVLGPGIGALGRVLQALSLVLVVGLAQQPLMAESGVLLAAAGPAYSLRWTAHLFLGRGQLRPLSVLRRELHTLGADLGSVLPDPVAVRIRGYRVLVALVIVLVASVAVRIAAVWAGAGGLSATTLAAALVVAGAGIGISTGVLVESHTYRQRRAHRRVRLGMVTCRLEEHEGFVVDLSGAGVGVALPDAGGIIPKPGSVTTLSFRVPAPGGEWRSVSTVVRVIRCAPDPEGGVRLGVEFDDPAAAPLDAVVEFLTSGSSWPVERSEAQA